MNWSSDTNISLIYRLMKIKGYGPAQTNRMLWKLRPQMEVSDDVEDLIMRNLPVSDKDSFNTGYELYSSMRYAISYMSVLDELYPKVLLETLAQNTPPVLACIGNKELLKKKKIAYSGSRKVSEKGIWITNDSISQLEADDVCIVAGYAQGVDLTAHRQALKSGMSTIMVLPEGIKYFSIKKELEDVWDWNRVLILSEFLPEDKWLAGRAMKRNQTLIGMSDAVVVVEAGETGGSFDAGVKSIEMQKCLYVPQYAVAPESALGNATLIRRGAKPLTRDGATQRTNMRQLMLAIANRQSCTLF